MRSRAATFPSSWSRPPSAHRSNDRGCFADQQVDDSIGDRFGHHAAVRPSSRGFALTSTTRADVRHQSIKSTEANFSPMSSTNPQRHRSLDRHVTEIASQRPPLGNVGAKIVETGAANSDHLLADHQQSRVAAARWDESLDVTDRVQVLERGKRVPRQFRDRECASPRDLRRQRSV